MITHRAKLSPIHFFILQSIFSCFFVNPLVLLSNHASYCLITMSLFFRVRLMKFERILLLRSLIFLTRRLTTRTLLLLSFNSYSTLRMDGRSLQREFRTLTFRQAVFKLCQYFGEFTMDLCAGTDVRIRLKKQNGIDEII